MVQRLHSDRHRDSHRLVKARDLSAKEEESHKLVKDKHMTQLAKDIGSLR